MFLKNYMELAVEHNFQQLLKAFPHICTCDKCINDIKALALNNLKPHYVVTDEGEIWTRVSEMNLQFETDVLKALIDAIAVVNDKPRHEKPL